MKLTEKECETLISALDVWAERLSSEGLIGVVVSTLMADSKGDAEKIVAKHKADAEADAKKRKVAAVRLKAKLYDIIDAIEKVVELRDVRGEGKGTHQQDA